MLILPDVWHKKNGCHQRTILGSELDTQYNVLYDVIPWQPSIRHWKYDLHTIELV